jgi:hypothetical protein
MRRKDFPITANFSNLSSETGLEERADAAWNAEENPLTFNGKMLSRFGVSKPTAREDGSFDAIVSIDLFDRVSYSNY